MEYWKDVEKEILSDPEVRDHFERLAPRFQLIKQLVERRKELKMSQAEMAARMKTKQSAIARIENGEANITLRTLEKMAGVLGCAPKISLKPLNDDENKEDDAVNKMHV